MKNISELHCIPVGEPHRAQLRTRANRLHYSLPLYSVREFFKEVDATPENVLKAESRCQGRSKKQVLQFCEPRCRAVRSAMHHSRGSESLQSAVTATSV
jgi:hypothetical protein